MYGPRLALWCLAAASFCLFFLSVTNQSKPMAVTFFFLAIALLGSAESYAVRRKRREKFDREFNSHDDFFRAVDREAVLRIREERGVAVAVRDLQRQYPTASLKTLARLVKEL
jgi:hypothetical protein